MPILHASHVAITSIHWGRYKLGRYTDLINVECTLILFFRICIFMCYWRSAMYRTWVVSISPTYAFPAQKTLTETGLLIILG
jgi:hypothetical protein